MGKRLRKDPVDAKYKSLKNAKVKKKLEGKQRRKEKMNSQRKAIRGVLTSKPKDPKAPRKPQKVSLEPECFTNVSTGPASSWDQIKNTIPDRKKTIKSDRLAVTGKYDTEDIIGATPCEKHPLFIPNGFSGKTKVMSIDCEMVGVGFDGFESALARVSIVNFFGHTLYDEYVKPLQTIVDYRTEFSGIRPEHMINAKEFFVVQTEVAELIKNRLLVGHAIRNDLRCLYLEHPKNKIRDTSMYKPFHKIVKTNRPKLKVLAAAILHQDIQGAEHNSVEDAQAAMRLYAVHRRAWEQSLLLKMQTGKKNKPQEEDFVSDMLQE